MIKWLANFIVEKAYLANMLDERRIEQKIIAELTAIIEDEYLRILRKEMQNKVNELRIDARNIVGNIIQQRITQATQDPDLINVITAKVETQIRKDIAKDYAYKILEQERII